MLTNLDDWLDYIGRQHSAEIVMGLDRVRAVWERMDCPRAPINVIVGGTNGKGSTCAMLESILHVAGFKTGFYSSPHLVRYNERVRIGNVDSSDRQLIASFEAVEIARTSIEPAVPLTYFEFATLSALWLFHQDRVDVAILEVGLGGRLDAVNIVNADVSIVVSVDLDHQSYLGNTREEIGFEKAHVYRTGRPAFFADVNPPQSLLDHAKDIGADLRLLNRDFRYQVMDGQWQFFGKDSARHSLPFPALRGAYQLKNASGALAALEALQDRLPVSQGQVKRGLLEVAWQGRMQVLPGRPVVVLDVAHNPHAARALNDALGSMGFHQNTYAVFGMLKDKDIDSVIDILKGRIDFWCIAGLETVAGERGATLEMLAGKLAAHGLGDRFSRHVSVSKAYAAAREKAGENDRILVFGSFYTVAEILQLIQST
ncbi:MAG: bifunctional tetrahydrofolate synthase/dihydrofolate synthase [Betaproteobacteria bacterium]|nr:bifunctional tetrahydrofolate synthase/dihydrofolate synthase [Betaproteobacteria bacterium]